MKKKREKRFAVRPYMESILLNISWEAVQDAEKSETELKTGSTEAHINMQRQCITAIVTAAMAAEPSSTSRPRMTCRIGVSDGSDNLSVTDKWIQATKKITGKELDQQSNVFKEYKKLVSRRNKLVHYKPKFHDQDTDIPPGNDLTGALARRSYNAASEIIAHLYELADRDVPPQLQPGNLGLLIMEIRDVGR